MSDNTPLYLGNTLLYPKTKAISLQTVTIEEEVFFKIENYNEMPPFFMTVVSDTDLWMFISSTGGLTCGRKNAESSLFPYYTDDKIHDSCETTGSHTVLMTSTEDKRYLWEPFTNHQRAVYHTTRNLYKNESGNKIMFEEINEDLKLSFSYMFKSSDQYGFLKTSSIRNLSDKKITVTLLDGIRNILPYGVNTLLQTNKSTLVDGYKRCELVSETGLGIYTLSSILTDKAEPSESLKATTVWSIGLDNPNYLLSELQVNNFIQGAAIQSENDIKGRRGAYYVSDTVSIQAKEICEWTIVADLNQGAADVEALLDDIRHKEGLLKVVNEDVKKGDQNLKQLIFESDGFSYTADEKGCYRHFSNTLYNIMRGGIYADGYTIDLLDYKGFIEVWNSEVLKRQEAFINGLPLFIDYSNLLKAVHETNDSDLLRLTYEYLPLTYSRRHGDPSRPWNKFNIDIRKADGSKKLKFEGNWRDIFQNWEALSMSYPTYVEGIICKFVNASTADGYNPYRITKEGIDWEVLDPEDPWSNIGYWGDHQIIYLLKLMELSKNYHKEQLVSFMKKDIFVYANVPYKIKNFDDLIKDPRNSIVYDEENAKITEQRVKSLGSDGKMLHVNDQLYKVNLTEKLLVTILAKISNYVPEGGIWMNTQRPEWNDANNALVGYGLSMVTLYYLHRFLLFFDELIEKMSVEEVLVSEEVSIMLEDTYNLLNERQELLGKEISNEDRMTMVSELGLVGAIYRQKVYAGLSGNKTKISKTKIKRFIETTLLHLKDSINKNCRADGLYHAYNLVSFEGNSCRISHLYEMLEGQVAVLSSKALEPMGALKVLKALKTSQLYREDQNSYMLYPNRALPQFLDKNKLDEEQVKACKILAIEAESGSKRLIEKDIKGVYHFNGQFRNGEDVEDYLKGLECYNEKEIEEVKELFIKIFNHNAFTGRSGTFYKYEGLGCIYWHMVSKLVLAAQENYHNAYEVYGDHDITTQLKNLYYDLKEGIGVNKSPEVYGAFPTDAYSHTPLFAGVQQPGMTGQVKEDILSRFRELGIIVKEGTIGFEPSLLLEELFVKEAKQWQLQDQVIELPENSLGFTYCTVPIVYEKSLENEITVFYKDGRKKRIEGKVMDLENSESIFNRLGQIDYVLVRLQIS